MDQKYLLFTVLAATLISSGCLGGGGGNNGLDIGPGGKTITVTEFEVQPDSIRAGSTAQIRLGIVNTGGMSSNVTIARDQDDTDNKGRKILNNNCPDIFTISDFDAYSSRNSEKSSVYNLEPGDELQLSWSLKNNNENIPLNGYTCPLNLQVPFDYGVTAYQQLEVKENSDVQGATVLESKTSEGPLNIHLEMIGSTTDEGAPKFLKGDNKEVLVQLENTAPEESSYQGLVELNAPRLQSSENYLLNSTSCNMETNKEGLVRNLDINRTVRLYEGQSRVIRCGVVLSESSGSNLALDEETPLPQPSIRGQIEAKTNYTYIKDLGEKSIEVKYRG